MIRNTIDPTTMFSIPEPLLLNDAWTDSGNMNPPIAEIARVSIGKHFIQNNSTTVCENAYVRPSPPKYVRIA